MAPAQTPVTVATYNIEWFTVSGDGCTGRDEANQHGTRLQRLRNVIAAMDADIIGLQEICDRTALEALFDPTQWTLVIDDQSGEWQDLALAVRKPFTVAGAASTRVDAGDSDFLFPGSANDSPFPDRRDVLAIEVEVPDSAVNLWVLNVHLKSRAGGRLDTAPRRMAAAQRLVERLSRDFDSRAFVLLGDFNDTPDDASLNVLESGDPAHPFERENEPGAFLVNLTEPLWTAAVVSYGLTPQAIRNGRVDLLDYDTHQQNAPGTRYDRDNAEILVDQILVPASVHAWYVPNSIAVLDHPDTVARDGGDARTQASDHSPVLAAFVWPARATVANGFATAPEVPAATRPGTGLGIMRPTVEVRIAGLLPKSRSGANDPGEGVRLLNPGTSAVALDGWTLRDAAGNTYPLDGWTMAAGAIAEVTLDAGVMPLNNDGDAVTLLAPGGIEIDTALYRAAQVQTGVWIEF